MVKALGGLNLPNLEALGLGLIDGVEGLRKVKNPLASYGRMAELSGGKDTVGGHWELSGLVLDRPFPTYPDGFPKEIMDRFKEETGLEVLGNRPASGTEIIKELGEEHMKTGKPIIYTSADSVFQIAAHEAIITPKELYDICRKARRILNDYRVGRVIARPFIGQPGSFKRTERRKDFSIPPTGETILDRLKARGLPVIGVGKVGDIFGHRGFTEEVHTRDNMDGMDKGVAVMKRIDRGLIFITLVDFDMLYGHRNDVQGYAKALVDVDRRLLEFVDMLKERDMFIISADHGCDPTTPSTDHSREYVPLLIYGKALKGVNLGTRKTFADVGQTIAEVFGVGRMRWGVSFLREIV